MRCPKCDSENNDSAKFCKKCGAPLDKKVMSHESMINSMSSSSSDNTTKYIIIALAVIAIVLAGAFVYIYGFGNNNSQSDSADVVNNDSSTPVQATQTSQSTSTPTTTSMSILGGSFTTGDDMEDKTYASFRCKAFRGSHGGGRT